LRGFRRPVPVGGLARHLGDRVDGVECLRLGKEVLSAVHPVPDKGIRMASAHRHALARIVKGQDGVGGMPIADDGPDAPKKKTRQRLDRPPKRRK
jgi:hypothetical protein